MPSNNWRGHVALAAISVAILLGLAHLTGNSSYQQREYRQNHQDQYAAYESLAWLETIRSARIQSGADATGKKRQDPEASADDDYTKALDLRAQWVTAIATKQAVSLTAFQVILGLLSLIGLGATVWFAREAARGALESAKHARDGTRAAIKSAEAAEQAVNTARESSKRELRAYVYFDGPKARWWPPTNSNRLSVLVDYVNGGQTWAHVVTVKQAVMRLAAGDTRDPFESVDWNKIQIRPIVLGPNQKFTAQMGDVPRSEFPSIASGIIKVYFAAKAEYLDAFGERRETRICSQLGVDSEGGYSFTFVSAHNCVDDDCQRF